MLKAVAKALPDQRQPWLVQHTAEQLLRQRVFGLCQGYEDLNDHDRLRDDLALQTAVGDVAATNRIVAREHTPVVLVGHSYGGVVITEAGSDPRVAGLVYIAAFGPVGTARVFC